MIKRLLVASIGLYQEWISPVMPGSCRFYPSCSQYMKESIDKFGVMAGLLMGARRLAQCHPFSKRHGHDPVPLMMTERKTEC